MRALVISASMASLVLVLLAPAACSTTNDAAAGDMCIQAKDRFASCGTSLPVLTDGPCSGTTKMVARCVVEHARDCDELATLFGRIDECVADLLDGGDALLPPATDLPVSPRDGGADGHESEAGRDVDAAPRPEDGGPTPAGDAGPSDSGAETRP